MKLSNCYRMKIVFVGFVAAVVLGSGGIANADYTFGTPTVVGIGQGTSPSVSTDGLSLYVDVHSSSLGGYGGYDIWVYTRETNHADWSGPVNLGPTINSSYIEGNPDISADGLTLFFDSDRPGGQGDRDIWLTTRASTDDPWSEPVNLGQTINGPYYDGHSSISSDGLSLYFSSNRPGGYGDRDTWFSTRATTSDPWSEPENLGPIVNSSSKDSGPDISSDGLMLFFVSKRPGGYGGNDIWVASRATTDDSWSVPKNLGAIVNTSASDIAAGISADGSILYYYTNGFLRQVPIEPVVDFDGNGEVDAQDMSILIDHWHTSDPLCDIGPTPLGDGRVDIQDMNTLSQYLEPGFGRIAHWKLDETEGTVAYDSIGSDHADVYGNAVWQPNAGYDAGALEFDGVDDSVAPMCILNPADGPFRIFAWIKGGAPGQIIVSHTPTETELGGTYLAADPADGTLVTELIFSPVPLKSDVVITDGEWHKVGLEWDGKYRHLFVDDTEVAVDDTVLPGTVNTGYLNIGTGKAFEDSSFWSGLIDDVRIYKPGSD